MIDDPDVLSDLVQLQSRYEVLGELGRDGAWVVYRGRSPRSEYEVAIKVLRTPPPAGPKPGARYGWQAHTVTQLHHPQLLELHGVHHLQGGTLALAMEHRGWPTLAETIRRAGPLPPEQVERVLREVAGALAYLHGHGVVHREVKPESIFLDPESGRALLAHFGIDAAGGGAVVRAFAFLAPEQTEGDTQVDGPALSAQSDLYSLGLVGWAMLTGRQPWEAASPGGVVAKQQTEPLPPLSTLRPEAPTHLRLAIEGALDRKPGRRWKSAEEFLTRLDPCAEPVAPARAIDWSALLAGVRGGVGALGRALEGHGIATRRGRTVLTASSVLTGVAVLSLLLRAPHPTPHPVMESWMPAVTALPPTAPVERAQADGLAPAGVPLSDVLAPPRAPAAEGPARGSASPAPRGSSPRSKIPPLLGELVPSDEPTPGGRPALLGAPTRTPRLLGTPVQPDRVGDAGTRPREGGGAARRQ